MDHLITEKGKLLTERGDRQIDAAAGRWATRGEALICRPLVSN